MKTSIIKKARTVIAMGAVAVVLTAAVSQAQVIRSSGSGGGASQTSSGQSAVIMAPNAPAQQGSMRTQLNYTGRRASSVTIYRTGDRVQNATLRILDANGNLVRRISVNDRGARSGRGERSIATWDLTDMTGRHVRGTFTITGTVRTQSGAREEVNLTVATRGEHRGHGEHRRGDGKRGARVEHVPNVTDVIETDVIDNNIVESAPEDDVQIIKVDETVEMVDVENAGVAVPLPADISSEVAPAAPQTPIDPDAKLRGDRDAFFERLDEAVGAE